MPANASGTCSCDATKDSYAARCGPYTLANKARPWIPGCHHTASHTAPTAPTAARKSVSGGVWLGVEVEVQPEKLGRRGFGG